MNATLANASIAAPKALEPATSALHSIAQYIFPRHAAVIAHWSSIQLAVSLLLSALLTLAALYLLTRFIAKSTGSSLFEFSHPPTLLLLGCMSSGKTTLFYQLTQSQFRPCFASQQENTATQNLVFDSSNASKQVQIFDFPGHKSRRHTLDKHLHTSRHIVFVIDGGDHEALVNDVTPYLASLLSNTRLQRRRVPITIFINKSDETASCSTVQQIKSRLCEHLTAQQQQQMTHASMNARASQLEDQDAQKAQPMQVSSAPAGQPFTFEAALLTVRFCSGSAKSGSLDELLTELAK